MTTECMLSDRPLRFLLTNDDGIDAPGLEALRRAAEGLGSVTVVAPTEAWSSLGHSVTRRSAIRIDRRAPDRIAVAGSPADCVQIALGLLDLKPDWVLSGINRGANLGADVHHSGTVAAAREAILHGVPAIAGSQYLKRGQAPDWDQAARWFEVILPLLIGRAWTPGTLWNVNVPNPEPAHAEADLVFCPVDPSPLPIGFRLEGDEATYEANYHDRRRVPGADVETCFEGRIALSRVAILGASGESTRLSHAEAARQSASLRDALHVR